jgi:hypothetical protein
MTKLLEFARLSGGPGTGAVAFFLTAGIAACGQGTNSGAASVRDSAGVVIVASRAPEWSQGAGWRVADAPFFEVGSVEGAPEYQFQRIEGAVRLEDGRVAVADGGSGEIRFFDQSGTFLNASGGQGDAPGEYRMISGLGSGPGDSLWVFDYGNRRFTVLTTEGEPHRTVSLGGFLSAAGAVGRLPNGAFVVKEGWGRAVRGATRTGLARDPVAVAVFAPDGSSPDTLGMFPGREVFISVEDGRAVMSAPLFAHNTSAAIRGDEVFVGIQENLEVGLYSIEGALVRLFRVPNAELSLSAADVAARKREVLSQQPVERRAEAGDQLDAMDVPNSRPAYGRLLVGADGSLWAAEQTRYPAIPTNWIVFGPDGHLLGEVAMPERFTLFQIGFDWVLGVGFDELDVEYVRLYRLEK